MNLIRHIIVSIALATGLVANAAWALDADHGKEEGSGGVRPASHRSNGLVFDGAFKDALEFFKPHKSGNGRSCATCHRPGDNFGLTPATVEARYQALQERRKEDPDADDPLFRSIDADDFDQDFTTLRTKALVRVVLSLPSNVRLADDPSARSVAVWRAVPTVVNAGISAPYQYDGRLETLGDQALSAMQAHSEIATDPKDKILARLARFQQHLFSSKGVRRLARSLAAGASPADPDPPLTELEGQGKATFAQFCASCHGGPTQTVNTDAGFLPVPQRGPWRARKRSSTFSYKPRGRPSPSSTVCPLQTYPLKAIS